MEKEEVERNLIERKEQVEVEVEVEVMVVRGLKGVKGIYEGSRGERKKERVMWSVGSKDRPRVFWVMCSAQGHGGSQGHWVYSSLLVLQMTTWTPLSLSLFYLQTAKK